MTDITFQPLGNPIAAGAGLSTVSDIDPRLTRTHYFDGRLLTAEDLTRDQTYLDQRLREMGRVLGSGIMSGLELSFDKYTGLLTLQPGQALTPAGRVLELGTELIVNLGDRALIQGLNDGNYRRFNRALYAVVLQYAEVATDIAEVFPKDLGSQRGFDYALVTEAVQMGLVPLPLPLPEQRNSLQIRSRLIRDLLGNSPFTSLIPEDAVTLGVLAIQNDTPQWLDAELLRHPLREEPGPGDLQADLSRQYEALLSDVLSDRTSAGLNGNFQARDYFSLLPPVGSLPKASVDPVNGVQGYFPDNYPVAIAPIRQSDVDLIRQESLPLPPIDLSSKEPVDIVVLVPLSNLDYGHYAAQLERNYDPSTRRLPQLDLLKLKLYPVQPVHNLDTDAAAWTDIWNRLGDNQPFYVRRPTRAAETAISGIVLAQGTAIPAPPPGNDSGPADSGGLIQDTDTQFLSRLNLDTLDTVRPAPAGDAATAFNQLKTGFATNAGAVLQVTRILLRLERRYDDLTWPTLLALANANQLEAFAQGLLDADPTSATPTVVVQVGTNLSLDNALLNQWTALES